MNSFVFTVSALLVIACYGTVSADKEKLMEIVGKCKEKEGVDQSEIESLKQHKLPDTDPGKCLLSCVLEEIGIMKNNAFSKEGALVLAEKISMGDAEKLGKLKTLLETCIAEVGEEPGERCDVGFKIVSCVHNNKDGSNTIFSK